MTAKYCYNYTRFNEDNTVGHKASYIFRLFYLSSKISWPFLGEYYTNCPVLPTAFKLDLTFHKVPLNGSVNISYTLERKDFKNRPVDAFVSIQISDSNGRVIFQPPNSFGRQKMISGETTRGNITGVITLPELRHAFNEQIDARIDLSIFFCHSGPINREVNVNTNENSTPGSKNAT
ncbi:hypothetical protein AVEN_74344-1 [Araneus ventricosus]|uniref:Uncharacterized protein n=1 Tax=Araneus ventricosus TaxID=182803 RepID=A0A4Y2T1X5_ARAVE|nr:hypothetical protein AVEN_74989-1 [Araneus ventricosus]GBN94602.1 hypothetical protein AVEN_74344-1 [Araneus ventricosus]